MKNVFAVACLVVFTSVACKESSTGASAERASKSEKKNAAAVNPAASAPAPTAPSGHDCASDNKRLQFDKTRTFTNAQGEQVVHVGRDFTEAKTVSVAQLLAEPLKYDGQDVKVQGDVSAMCHHKRAWFALSAGDQSGRSMRVLTTPVFLVPAGSIGKAAIAEGTVEVMTVAADHARHIAAEHKLGDPAAITADVKQVVLRASGADFI